MKINNSIFEPLRPDRAHPSEGTTATRPGAATTPGSPLAPVAPHRDSVQISDSARTLASGAQAEQRASMNPAHVDELRKKVFEGAYNALDVVDQVARRILTRGDL